MAQNSCAHTHTYTPVFASVSFPQPPVWLCLSSLENPVVLLSIDIEWFFIEYLPTAQGKPSQSTGESVGSTRKHLKVCRV